MTLREPNDHRAGLGAPKQAMDPRHSNFKASQYVCVLIQGKTITPMFEEPVGKFGKLGDMPEDVADLHSTTAELVEGMLQGFCHENNIHFTSLIQIDRYYDLGDLYGSKKVLKESRFLSLEHGYMFMIRHQFTHASYEDDQEALAKTVVALQAGFVSYEINNDLVDPKQALLKETLSEDVRVALAIQGHVAPDIDWLDLQVDIMPEKVQLALENVWGLQ